MRLLTSPWWFSLLGGVDLAALAFSVRKLGVARRVAAGDLSAAIELSSVDAAFSFVLPLAVIALAATLVSGVVLGAHIGRGPRTTMRWLAPAALAVALCGASALLDVPSAEPNVVVIAALLLVAGCVSAVGSVILAGTSARHLRQTPPA